MGNWGAGLGDGLIALSQLPMQMQEQKNRAMLMALQQRQADRQDASAEEAMRHNRALEAQSQANFERQMQGQKSTEFFNVIRNIGGDPEISAEQYGQVDIPEWQKAAAFKRHDAQPADTTPGVTTPIQGLDGRTMLASQQGVNAPDDMGRGSTKPEHYHLTTAPDLKLRQQELDRNAKLQLSQQAFQQKQVLQNERTQIQIQIEQMKQSGLDKRMGAVYQGLELRARALDNDIYRTDAMITHYANQDEAAAARAANGGGGGIGELLALMPGMAGNAAPGVGAGMPPPAAAPRVVPKVQPQAGRQAPRPAAAAPSQPQFIWDPRLSQMVPNPNFRK